MSYVPHDGAEQVPEPEFKPGIQYDNPRTQGYTTAEFRG